MASSPTRRDGEPSEGEVEVVYYTDPLCCWSWALEPAWRRLRAEFAGEFQWRNRMGGLIAGWDSYADPLNDVSRPAQMGPIWVEARHLAGVPLNDRLWITDPPDSSHPACVAVKAAALQGAGAEERYLRRLREACMVEGRNVARREVLHALADELAAGLGGEEPSGAGKPFDAGRFRADLEGDAAREAFREDLREARYLGVGRFPTLTFRRPPEKGIIVTGYRPYASLRAALRCVAPQLAPA